VNRNKTISFSLTKNYIVISVTVPFTEEEINTFGEMRGEEIRLSS
jgi:hypothetical protein